MEIFESDYQARYKICPPETTLNIIKTILSKYDIEVTENVSWNSEQDEIPQSISISISQVPFIANGKGINRAFALASAYAELLERLQNLGILSSVFRLNEKEKRYIATSDKVELCNISKAEVIVPDLYKIIDKNISNFLKNALNKEELKIGSAIKYFCVNNNSVVYLPDELLVLSAGSNGMCAGNSISEALIQGFCEVFERIVLKQMYLNDNAKFPIIPLYLIEEIGYVKYIKYFIERGFIVTVRDCSLGGVYPVVGLFLEKNDSFCFNLGSAPNFNIALERCFTEILQGKNGADVDKELTNKRVILLDKENEKEYWERQLRYSFTHYGGNVKSNVFLDEFSKEGKKVFFDYKGRRYEDILIKFLNIFIRQNMQVYIRDTSFLGFPTFHIFIPGVSNIFDLSETDFFIIRNIERAGCTLESLNKATQQDIETLIVIIDRLLFDKSLFLRTRTDNEILSILLGLPQEELNHNIDVWILLVLLYCYVDRFEDAFKMLELSKHRLKNKTDLPEYFFQIIRLKKEGKTDDDIVSKLEIEFSSELIKEVFFILNNPAVVSLKMKTVRQSFNKGHISKLLEKISRIIKSYDFNQRKLEDYFKNLIITD